MKKLIYQGSAKNIFEINKDIVEFEFTDQYSIFDYGKMPDKIPLKGKYLTDIAERTFEKLNLMGIKNHFIKRSGPKTIQVKKYFVPNVSTLKTYDYRFYQNQPTNTLIPLEIVFRFGLPEGSSLLKNEASFKKDYPHLDFGPGIMFEDDIIIQCYTKLEKLDRKLSWDEACQISGLNSYEKNKLIALTKKIALWLKNLLAEKNFLLWDGKLEFAFGEISQGNREIILIDSIGIDELRITKDNIHYSKERLRQYYIGSPWQNELKLKKELYQSDFLQNMNLKPESLNEKQLKDASAIYQEMAHFFKDSLKKILILGSGGREHALANHLANDQSVLKVFVAPGNPGMASEKIIPTEIPAKELTAFCLQEDIAFVIIGPEDIISSSINLDLNNAQIPTYAPSFEASKLESSKTFAKNLMQKYNIPTADFVCFQEKSLALDFVFHSSWNRFVIKKSGLCAGKGVFISESKKEAINVLQNNFCNNDEIIIEEFLEGNEVSYFALCLESAYKILGHACDYKRLNDGNLGPNTGGMGCYSPATWLTLSQENEIEEKIIKPTLAAMIAENLPFKGTLFIGLMMTKMGPKVLEYNVRFGDPETQTLLPLINTSLVPLLESIAKNNHEKFKLYDIELKPLQSVHVVKASEGYPGTNGKPLLLGQTINSNIHASKNILLTYAGVKKEGDHLINSGGRVLGITALSEKRDQARDLAYKNIEKVFFKGEQFRGDIGL